MDISYLNLGGTFYFLISVLDGFSRSIVRWDISEEMEEIDVEMVLQKALETTPGAQPRIISDDGPQFVAKDFKVFLRIFVLTHVRTSPYYPQSNGKLERWHGSIKDECIRPSCPRTIEEAIKRVTDYVDHYKNVRLHSAEVGSCSMPSAYLKFDCCVLFWFDLVAVKVGPCLRNLSAKQNNHRRIVNPN